MEGTFKKLAALLLLVSFGIAGFISCADKSPLPGEPGAQYTAAATESPADTAAASPTAEAASEAPAEAPSEAPSAAPSNTPAAETEAPAPGFEAHFLNVGEGDSALVLCDGHAALIDGGDKDHSSLVYAYLKSHSVTRLDYVFATHSDADHIGGLAGALNFAAADNVFCSVDTADTKAFADFKKYVEMQGLSITVPEAGAEFELGSAHITLLGPIRQAEGDNNNSLVLRVVYNGVSILFTGDMEREEEQDLLGSGAELKSDILKAAHHGSKYSTTYPFLREVMPDYAVISVGENQYGHPTDETLSKLRDAEVKVFRTDLQGHIIIRIDGNEIKVIPEKNPDADTYAAPTAAVLTAEPTAPPRANTTEDPDDAEVTYILNKSRMVFHYPDCSAVKSMKEKNKIYFTGTREEAIALHYKPCGICHP